MANPDSTLTAIETKVRRLTRAPSEQQLSTTDLDDYINTFVLYDFPSQLRLFALKQQFTFYTAPNIDTYSTVNAPTTSPLYNFKNQYISIHPPFYIGGLRAQFTQSLSALYDVYSKIQFKQQIATGNGSLTLYTGTLTNVPFLQNNVIFSTVDSGNNALTYIDQPVTGSSENGNLINAETQVPRGTINYLTGGFLIDFESIPANGASIFAQTTPYSPALPVMICYYGDQFIVRPVPDGVYSVTMEVYARPTALLAGQSPFLEQWWQFIAYGAAKKICEDRLEMELVQMLMPEYENQKEQILNTTIVQNSNKRMQSPFAEQVGSGGVGGPGSPTVFNN